ncbi:MAG: polysaccharide deacetylase family protein [Proteobacteria bacterium]|nr:MAG: polysaccharide deacetylase family protein [Pseudomonadota bacterium]
MRFYWIRTHYIIKKLFPRYVWSIPTKEKVVYLTFDDGPIPEVTDFVLDQLRRFEAKATFFCIGDNIDKNPEIFKRVIADGHAFGNHTYNHLNGWNTPDDVYVENIKSCRDKIDALASDNSKLMRPPYAKVTRKQSKKLLESGYRIIMWDVLSADFDQSITPQKCLENVVRNIRPGRKVRRGCLGL